MRTMRFVCRLALPVGIVLVSALGSLNGARAQNDEATQACTPDAMRLCSEFIPDREKVRLCMLRKRSELSETCRTAMRAGAREYGRHEYHHRHVVRRRHHED
jgi:hypothetical protein